MKKILLKSFLFLFIFGAAFVVFSGSASATTTLEVGSGQTYSTIQAAVNWISTNDNPLTDDYVINVHSGTYNEEVTISGLTTSASNDITIQANTGDTVLIDGESSRDTGITIQNDYVTIDGINVTQSNENGIKVDSGAATRTILQNCEIYSNKANGVGIDGAEYVIMLNMDVNNNNGRGIIAINNSELYIEGGNSNNNGITGITFNGAFGLVKDYTASSNLTGIFVNSTNDVSIDNAILSNNDRMGLSVYESSSVDISNSTINGNNLDGVRSNSNSDGLEINKCSVYSNGNNGITISRSNSSNLRNNTITGNTFYGVQIMNGSLYPNVTNNLIAENNLTNLYLNTDSNYFTVENNTLASSTSGSGFAAVSSQEGSLYNNIVYGNNQSGLYGDNTTKSNISYDYNLVNSNSPNYNNLEQQTNDVVGSSPDFASDGSGNYYLSQTASGQGSDSPAVDAGSKTADSAGLQGKTTRTDKTTDSGVVDLGYHYLTGAAASDFTVCSSGCDYSTIQGAVDNASPGTTITITDSNTYNEEVTVSSMPDLTIEAAPGETPTVSGQSSRPTVVTISSSPGAEIGGFIAEQATGDNILIEDSAGTKVKNVVSRNAGDDNVHIARSPSSIIESSEFDGAVDDNIEIEDSSDKTQVNTSRTHDAGGDGVEITSSDKVILMKVDAYLNSRGIYMDASDFLLILGRFQDGVYDNTNQGLDLNNGERPIVDDTHIRDNGSEGIDMEAVQEAILQRLLIYANANGLKNSGGIGGTLRHNRIYSNTGYGTRLESGADGFKCLNNVFDENGTNQIETASASGTVIKQNTIVDSPSGNAIQVSSVSSADTVENNIIHNNGGNGIEVEAGGSISNGDHNLVNANGNNYQGVSAGPNDVQADPQRVTGPQGLDIYVSSVQAGEATDSPALEAGSETPTVANVRDRTIVTNNKLDDGANVSIGYHLLTTGYFLYDVPSGLSTVLKSNETVDVESTPQTGVKTVVLKDGSNIVAEIPIQFSRNSDWSDVTAEYDTTSFKAVAYIPPDNHDEIYGGVHKLRIPKDPDADYVYICIGATELADVYEGCIAEPNVTQELKLDASNGYTVGAVSASDEGDYWEVDGLIDEGGGNGNDGDEVGGAPEFTPLTALFALIGALFIFILLSRMLKLNKVRTH